MQEVIETFSSRDFLGMSVTSGIDNQIEAQEHDELISSIQTLKEKNQYIRT